MEGIVEGSITLRNISVRKSDVVSFVERVRKVKVEGLFLDLPDVLHHAAFLSFVVYRSALWQ